MHQRGSSEAAGETPPDPGMRFSSAELQAVVCDMTEALREQGIGTGEVEEFVNALPAGREAVPRR